MICGIVLCVILAKPDAAPAPSHGQVAEAVLAGRQKVKTLQVRSYCRRLLVSLNQPIPEDVFSFAGMGLPVGHRVMDVTEDSADTAIWDGEKVVRLRGVPPLAGSETGQTK